MASGQGYIETQNPALRSLVVGSRSSGMNPSKMSGIGNGKPTERYATYSEVYGPFREDSMELKEETAYQRGMKEHIRENMESINKLNTLPDPLLATDYHQQWSETSSSDDPLDQPFYAGNGMLDAPQGTHPGHFHGSMVNTTGTYNELDLTDDFSRPYRPKVTYFELAQKTPRKPPPPPSRTYTEMLMEPKTYSKIRVRDGEERETVPSFDVTYLQRNPSTPKFGVSSLPIGWKASALSPPEQLWEQRSQGLGKFANRNARGNNRSLDLNTSRIPHHMPGNSTFPLATVRLPTLSNAQSMPSLHTVDRNQGNANPGKLNIDINLKMDSSRGDNIYGLNQYSSEMVHGNSYNSVPPLVLNPLASLPPVPFNPQLSVPPILYQPFSNRNSVQVNQQMMDATPGGGSTIYPYRQMNNPWFPPQDELPTVRKNLRRGKYGHYRVFGIHDYKKLQKELRLGSLVGEQKDVETMQEKKEKRAILQEYGRLVRAKNREEMRPPLPL